MGLINRVAISNMLNFYGDGSHKDWSPRIRYECLDFRGQSAAINLTNGGGKTTLAEAWLAVLSRDHSLVSRTKKKFSPKSSGVWSHVQVELVRPLGNTGQSDLFTSQGNEVHGEHWVFGMYGSRGSQGVNYYYYKGRLEDTPIGWSNDGVCHLSSNEDFVRSRKSIPGLVISPHENEWEEALAYKVGLPQSTLRQMADFQKRGGQDKSALMYEIKPRPGQSYAEVFFYKVLAPAIMEGIMDREGEEGEVSLEDSVERSVFSTVKAKQDTEAMRRETEELALGTKQLGKVMHAAEEVEHKRAGYERQLAKIQTDVQVLTKLAGKGRLPGIPRAQLPDGLVGEVARHLVVEPGSIEARVLDRGLAVLMDKEVKHVNEHARRNNVDGHESMQVIEIPCDLFLQGQGLRGNKPRSYSIEDAKALLRASHSVGHNLIHQAAIEHLEDAVDWFDHKADTNPFRRQYVEQDVFLKQLRRDERDLEKKLEDLLNEQAQLQQQQKRMKTNEGLYTALVESGLFSDDELKAPEKTADAVGEARASTRQAMSDFEILDAKLNEHVDAWDAYVFTYGVDRNPDDTYNDLEIQRKIISEEKLTAMSVLNDLKGEEEGQQSKLQHLKDQSNKVENKLERFAEYRESHERYVKQFGGDAPIGKEELLRKSISTAGHKVTALENQQAIYQEGVSALHWFRDRISESDTPEEWLGQVIKRRAKIAIESELAKTQYDDLKNQREALEKERIAANAATRKALDCLGEKGITYQPLHHAIDAMGLPQSRKRQVLGVFSALLFAPVLSNEQEAQKAAHALAELGAQVPVFLYRSITDYCRNATVESVDEESLLVGTTSGIITRSVDCLLDPGLVEREKALLEGKIGEMKTLLLSLSKELASIGDDAESVVKGRRAAQAVTNEEAEKLNAVQGELEYWRDEFERLQEQTSPSVIEMIRSAASYDRLGGKTEDDTLAQTFQSVKQNIMLCQECLDEIRCKISKQNEALNSLDERLHAVLPGEVVAILKSASQFYRTGGPAFKDTYSDQQQKLTDALQLADRRYEYNKHFSGAQAWIDSQCGEQSGEKLYKLLGQIARDIEAVKYTRRNIRTQLESLSESVPLLRRIMESIDKTALMALKKYRQVVSLSEDAVKNNHIDISEDPLIMHGDDLTNMLTKNEVSEEVKQLADMITAALEDVDIERKAADLKRERNDLTAKSKAFVTEAHAIARAENGLKPVERQILKEVEDDKGIQKVRDLYEALLEQLNRSNERLQQYESSERESRQLVTSRLAHLIDYAAADLNILKGVVGSNHGKFQSFFNVDAEVLNKEGIQRLMDGIVAEVDIHEKQRREREEQGTRSDNNDEYHAKLRDNVREKLYKGIFSDPKITYVNTTIRGAGDAHEFNENLSEGQKAALSLMWAIRLAEFAIEREAKRLASRRSQQKAREMSVNIMIIDGLFSNLSNRELIESSMAGIESTRGSFQLIGLIHNPYYQNDFDKFPVFIIGKNESNGLQGDEAKGWVSFRERMADDRSMRTAQIRYIPPKEGQ